VSNPGSRPTAQAVIERIIHHNAETRSLLLRPASGQRLAFLPGQFLSLLLPVEGEVLTRPYSIASDPEESILLEICLNLVPRGKGSRYLFERTVGEQLQFTGPWGTFTLDQPPPADCVFVADGTGIAPIRPMIHRALTSEARGSLHLLYHADTKDRFLYWDEWETATRKHERFIFDPILLQPPPYWGGLGGSLLEHVDRRYVTLDKDRTRHFYLCGVGPPVLRLRDLLRAAGYERRAVHYEKW
jgi:ferredoxin-NADP reductase